MGEVSTRDKRDKLRLLYQSAAKAEKSLESILITALSDADEVVNGGQIMSSTTEAGGSVAFQIMQEFSPVTARRLIGELIDLLEWVAREEEITLGGPDGADETGNDAALYAAMMAELVAVRRYQSDYTELRSASV